MPPQSSPKKFWKQLPHAPRTGSVITFFCQYDPLFFSQHPDEPDRYWDGWFRSIILPPPTFSSSPPRFQEPSYTLQKEIHGSFPPPFDLSVLHASRRRLHYRSKYPIQPSRDGKVFCSNGPQQIASRVTSFPFCPSFTYLRESIAFNLNMNLSHVPAT